MTADEALLALLAALRASAYDFVTVTPATHTRVLSRPAPAKLTLRDIFGWNRSFTEDQINPKLLRLLRCANSLEETEGRFRSLVRVATLNGELFLHSAFPTDAVDAVFFGPDTYRFAKSIAGHLSAMPPPYWVVDLGAGSGAGAVVAAKYARPRRLTMVDVNPLATRFARLNASSAGITAGIIEGTQVPRGCDLIIANPPYLMDEAHRTYRDGGERLGGETACTWTSQSLDALAPGGSLILYTGAAVVGGSIPLIDRLVSLCSNAGAALHVDEIDPDVFGEELNRAPYGAVERIAALVVKITVS